MVRIKHKVKINRGAMNLPNRIINEALPMTARRTLKAGEEAAKQSYLRQRKSGGPSAIISSFVDRIQSAGSSKVIGVLQAGGPQAPYAVWVNFGHRLRDGSWWEGYHFMEDGGGAPPGAITKMNEVVQQYFDEEVRMIRRGL